MLRDSLRCREDIQRDVELDSAPTWPVSQCSMVASQHGGWRGRRQRFSRLRCNRDVAITEGEPTSPLDDMRHESLCNGKWTGPSLESSAVMNRPAGDESPSSPV